MKKAAIAAIGFAAALSLGLTLGPSDQAEAKTRLSISSWGSPKHPQVTQFVPQFVEAVEKKSDGEIAFRVFESGEMVKQQFVQTAVPQGTVDISLTTLDTWSGRIADVSVTTSPLWPYSMQETRDKLLPGSPVFEYFNAALQENGAVLLALFDIGSPVLTSGAPILKPGDMKGKTIRTYSKGAGEILQALEASPVTMGVGDVYSGLQRGTIDGALGGIQGAVGLKHYEVTKNALIPNGLFGTLIHGYVMNKDKWESLSPEMQEIVQSSATEARNHAEDFMIQSYADFVEQFRKNGLEVTVVEPGSADWEAWMGALSGLAEEARGKYSPELVKLLAE